MKTAIGSWRAWGLGALLLLALTTLAFAQFGGAGLTPGVKEFTHQEVQAEQLVPTLNDLSKQGWEVFQIVPNWTVKNENNEAELVPKNYQVFARRPVAAAK